MQPAAVAAAVAKRLRQAEAGSITSPTEEDASTASSGTMVAIAYSRCAKAARW